MHIIFIAGWYPDDKNVHHGVFIKEHAKSVMQRCDVSLVSLKVEKLGGWPFIKICTHISKDEKLTIYEISAHIILRRFGMHNWIVKRAYKKVFEEINRQKRVDLAHINVRTHITKLANELSLIKSLPMVYTEHWSYYKIGLSKLSPKDRNKEILNIKEWYRSSNLKAILPVSQEYGKVLEQYGAKQNKISVIPNVANPIFRYAHNYIPDKRLVKILLVAKWEPPKNLVFFIKTVSILPNDVKKNIEINIVGEGSQISLINTLIADGYKCPKIYFHGFKEKQFIAKELAKASFLVHPSNSENLPAIIIESICSGTPVLASNVGGIPELINKGNGLLFRNEESEDFQRKLIDMIRNYNSYDRKKISKLALSKYSRTAVGEQIFEVYKRALK